MVRAVIRETGQKIAARNANRRGGVGARMSIWRIWGETSRIIVILCLTTALAAVTAAVILLVHEDLTERLSDRVKRGIGRKTGILALVAAGVWILVIGQSVAAVIRDSRSLEMGKGFQELESPTGP